MSLSGDSETLSSHILSAPAPALFLDTCTILDVVRAPSREHVPIWEIESALELIRLAGMAPPQVWLIACETIFGEWRDNIVETRSAEEKKIKQADKDRSKLISIANLVYGGSYALGQEITPLDLPQRLEKLSNELLLSCLELTTMDAHLNAGMRRTLKYIAPASRAKQEAKDCQIFESFLDIGARLRSKGFNRKICFVTANKNDYGEPRNPRDPIGKDLENIQADYLNSLNWALAVVRGRT